jgi:hypothetical protein
VRTLGISLSAVFAAAALFRPGGGGERPRDFFTDITREAGISWRHFNGESSDRFLIETSCGGAAMLDFDNDGRLDILLVNGGETPKGKSAAPVRNALYRNLGNGKFEDVAERAGIARVPFFGMGAAVADYDNDGFPDVLITGYPSSALFHNNRDGTFTNVTERAGVGNPGEWAASAAWFDYDRDGLLDLFICNYAHMSFAEPRPCDYQGVPAYCDQRSYQGSRSRLYHNNGDGTFTDVSERSGVSKRVARAFGVVAVDADGDGWPDLFVASDAMPNMLLINRRDGTFADQALEAEVAFNIDGMARSGMGVDAGDIKGDGRPDFVVTYFHDEFHALYINHGRFPFDDFGRASRLAAFTAPYVGWGVRMIDYDNDGSLDLLIANGHVTETIEKVRRDITYRQPALLLANNGKGVFRNVSAQAGPAFAVPYSGRGLAAGDIDNDGDVDAVLVTLNGPPVLLRNNVGNYRPWIGLQLRGTKCNRDAVGAKVTVKLPGRNLVRWITGGGSFLASHDRRLTIGLGGDRPSRSVAVDILWPDGSRQSLTGLQPDRYHEVVQAR